MAQTAATPAKASTEKVEPAGSRYVQCDGEPNNVTGGETAARLLGAVTLLALFAPPPEAADASKRKFGAEGVAVCTSLLEGDKQEGNANRRIRLILGRAIHQIEAKNYDAAIADAALARKEAEAAGLMASPYYARSQGRAFTLIRAAALFRQNKAAEARDLQIGNAPLVRHSFFQLGGNQYGDMVRTGTPAEADFFAWRSRAGAYSAYSEADRLEELGRFKEAATVREALVDYMLATAEMKSSTILAASAVSSALAGNVDLAKTRAAEAKANFDQRKADGKAETNAAEYVELMDLYGIITMANDGNAKGARRLFAARSQWVVPSFGTVLEMTRRLRTGAAPDELIGGLARDPDQLWKDRSDTSTAALLGKDSDNKTLFYLIPPVSTAGEYEAVSKTVWNVTKSKIVLNAKPKDGKPRKFETMFLYGMDPYAASEGYLLHAALLAKSRGHQGFTIMPVLGSQFFMANVLTGNRGAPGLPDALFNDADQVITDLSPLIPSPEELKRIRAERAAKR